MVVVVVVYPAAAAGTDYRQDKQTLPVDDGGGGRVAVTESVVGQTGPGRPEDSAQWALPPSGRTSPSLEEVAGDEAVAIDL